MFSEAKYPAFWKIDQIVPVPLGVAGFFEVGLFSEACEHQHAKIFHEPFTHEVV